MATFLSDTFTDTNGTALASHTGETGATWTKHGSYSSGAVQISGSARIRSTAASAISLYYASGSPASADYSVTANYRVYTSASDPFTLAGVAGRINTAANTYYVFFGAKNQSTEWVLRKYVAGVSTDLDTYDATIAADTTYQIKLEMIGTSIKAYIDGVEVCSATDSAISAAGKAGVFFYDQTANDTNGPQLLDIEAADPASDPVISTVTLDENGYDVRITFDQDVSGDGSGFTVKVGGNAVSLGSKVRTGERKLRLRIANSDGPVLSGQTVTLDYDLPVAGEITSGTGELQAISGQSVTNNSLQTATTIVQAGVTLTFGSSFASGERGITAANRWWFTKDPQSRSPAASGSSTSFRNGSMKNPTSSFNGDPYGFDGRASSSSDSYTVSFPVTMSNNDSLVCALSIANETTWSSTTAYTVGQVLKKTTFGSDRYFVCSTAGTSGGAEPTWTDKPNEKETITDGSVVWANHGRTPIEAFVVFTKRDTALAQSEFAPCFSGGSATKTIYDSDDLNLAALPGWSTTVETVSVDTALALVIRPHVEITTSSGGEGQHAWGMPRQYGLWCAQDTNSVLGVIATTTTYATELIHHAVQLGIDSKGMRESGAHWRGSGGHGQGRLGYLLLAGALLGDSTFATAATATGAAGAANGYGELNQIFYVSASDVSSGRYTYAGGDDFPSAVQGSWLYVPEWGREHESDPTQDDKDWEADAYRTGSVYYSWNAALLMRYLSLETNYSGGAFADYMLRYRKIQGDAGTALGDKALFDANKTAAYGAFAVTSAILSSGNTKLTITTNRYATGTGTGFALTGGKTLSNFVQLGPRTFRFDVDTAVGTETLSYTQASGDFIDATNAELAAFSGMVPTVVGGAVAAQLIAFGEAFGFE